MEKNYNESFENLTKIMREEFVLVHQRFNDLAKDIYCALNTDDNKNYISLVEIAAKYGVTYQGVHKKVYNHIDPTKIIKVRNLLSIPRTQVRYLGYKVKQEVKNAF